MVASSRRGRGSTRRPQMTPLSRWVAPAMLALALGMVAGPAGSAHAQEAARAEVRVDADTVVVRNGQAYRRDARSGRYERVQVRRDRNGRLVYFRVVPRRTHDDGYRGGYGSGA